MLKTDRFQNAAQSLEQINSWQIEQEAKEEKQKSLIQEKNRNRHIINSRIERINFEKKVIDSF